MIQEKEFILHLLLMLNDHYCLLFRAAISLEVCSVTEGLVGQGSDNLLIWMLPCSDFILSCVF